MHGFNPENIANEEVSIGVVSGEVFAADCKLDIICMSPGKQITFSSATVSRPGLFLAGYENYYANSRVVVLGNAEISYLCSLTVSDMERAVIRLMSSGIPCVVISRGIKPLEFIEKMAIKYEVPLFVSGEITSQLVASLNAYLDELLAIEEYIHGVLMDVNGMGVLLLGKSGIGKSETALELVHRGHRLVADDSVIVKKTQAGLVGYSPEVIRYMMEIRGVGIINVERMYGSRAVKAKKPVEMVIELVAWEENKEYERLGNKIIFEELLGAEVPKYTIPVRPGRNLSIVIESAVGDRRLKSQGYNAALELDSRLKGNS